MNGFEFLLDGSVWQQQAIRLSLTILHFVWQGVLVGVVAAIALAGFSRKSANTRYWIACVAFFGLALLAAATFWLVEVPVDVAIASPSAIENGDPILAESLTIADSLEQPLLVDTLQTSNAVLPSESAAPTMLENMPAVNVLPEAVVPRPAGLAAIYPLLPLVAAAYVTGALVLLLRLQLRIWRGSRLCSRSPAVQDPSLLDLAARLAKQAGLKCVPAIRYCDRIVVPAVVGILKPVVLVPASLISQLTLEELTAILNHELAHIRRWDPVVQVFQKTVEALLFFHPVTWWLSRRIRVERENCCDDIASRGSGQLSYAAALLRMAELCVGHDQKRSTALADLAVDGNNKTEFASRIRRLIGADDTPSFGLSRRGVYMLLAVGLSASVSFAAATNSRPSVPAVQLSESESEPSTSNDDIDPDEFSAVVRFVGGDQAEPIPGLQVTAVLGYGKEAKKYGPFTTDKDGKTKVSLPTTGGYWLKLDSANETPWLPVDILSSGTSGSANRRLRLNVTNAGIEKWIDGKTRPRTVTEDQESIISFNLIRGCEVVLRAVDAETGAGIAGAEFNTQNALGEDWAHEIFGDNVGFRKPNLTKDRRTDSAGTFTRRLGADAGYAYGVETAPPGYKRIEPSEEVKLDIRFGKAKAEHVFRFNRMPEYLWSKKKRNGLVAGAKLLSATGKLKLGDPVVVQFVLKNVSDKEQTFVLQSIDLHPTLGQNNRLELNVWGYSQNTFQHTLKPGEILVKREYRVSVDTNGMPPGKYHITTSSAFWQAKKDNPDSASGIPFGREIPFTLGDPDSVKLNQPPADENPETKIYWGKPSGNLILGMRLSKGRQTWPDDQTDIQGQLFLFNAGDEEVELTCELPANVANWNMHVTSRDHDNHVKLDSTWFYGIEPLRKPTRTVRIPSGEQTAITGVRADVTTGKKTAAEMIQGPTLRVLKEKTKFKWGDPKRLINQQGRFSFHAALTIYRAGLTDVTIVASSAPVPFEIKAGGDTGSPEPSSKKMPQANPSESEPSAPSFKPKNSEQSKVAPSASKRVVAATVLGKPIYLDQFEPSAADLEWLRKSGRTQLSRKAEGVLARVAGKIMMDYYRREELHPTKAEISAKYSAAVRSDPELLAKMMLNKNARFEIGGSVMFGVASSVDWVITKHLHEKYGGSVSVSSFGGMMSIEGRNALIREYVARGDVQFQIPELEQALWERAEKKRALDATVSDQKRVKQMLETPPWESYLAHRKKMEREQAPTEQESMSERILTLYLFPFPEDPLWMICETEVSSLDDIEELGSDACQANTTIKTFSGDDKKAALKRGRELMKSRKLPLYLLTIEKQGGPDTLEEIGAPDVKNNDD